MRRRIDVLHAYGEYAARVLRAAGELGGRDAVVWTRPEQLTSGLGNVEALLGVRIPVQPTWAPATRLRLVQLAGSGTDGFLPAPGLPLSVVVASARGVSAPAMAEFAVGMLLTLAKRVPAALRNQAARRWEPVRPAVLSGCCAVVVGAGPVGRAVGRLLRALGMRVLGVRQTAVPCEEFDETYPAHAIDDVLPRAQALVIAVPSTPDTRGLFGVDRLARCAPGCLLVNISRGAVLDEAAVAGLLESGRLGGAALDVFAREPLPADSPFWTAPNALLTPHVAWSMPEYERQVAELFLANVARVEAGHEPRNVVDVARGY